MNTTSKIFLIPTFLAEDALQTLPNYIVQAVQQCDVFFAENIKTTRRYFKQLCKEMVIDNYEWHAIHKAEEATKLSFIEAIKQQKNIGIVSEAGCPCIADPGQILVDMAQQLDATIVPLVGPSSIILSLMASGLNGQMFQFIGYLPIDKTERINRIKELERTAQKNKCTQIFIETPYRNNQLFNDLITTLQTSTKLCVGVNITSATETIITKQVHQWHSIKIDLHKKQVIFLVGVI